MQIVTEMLLSNAILATLLAAVVFVVTRIYKNHFAAHLLWLLVLIKLMSPPLIGIPQLPLDWKSTQVSKEGTPLAMRPSVEFSAIESLSAAEQPLLVEADLGTQVEPSIERRPVVDDQEQKVDEPVRLGAVTPWNVVAAIWVIGSVLWCMLAGWRLARFAKLLRKHAVSDEQIQGTARNVAAKIGLRRCPQIMLTPAKVPPFVWAPWRPIVVLPRDLVKQLDRDQIETLLAHELIHLRRGDHWIRRYEMILSAVFWWHPVFWLAVKELHIAEEQCCDAAVVQDFPKQTYKYSEVLLKAAEFVCPPLPATAIPFGQGRQLVGRVSMVLQQGFSRRLSSTSLMTMGAMALALLPLSVPGMEAPLVGSLSTLVAGKASDKPDGDNGKIEDSSESVSGLASNEEMQNQDGKKGDDVQLEEQLVQAGNHFNKSDSGSINAVFFVQSEVDGKDLKQLQGFPELEGVSLESTNIAVDDLVHLKDLKGLKSIHLNEQQFSPESLVHLQAMPNLRALNLRGDSIDIQKCQLFKQLPNLEELRLFGADLSDDELKIFQELPKLSKIMIFGARPNQPAQAKPLVSNAGLLTLAGIKNLKSLHLGRGIAITDDGLEHLKNLSQLEELQITSNDITDRGLAHLEGLVDLKVINISGDMLMNLPGSSPKRSTQFSDKGLQSLSRLTKLQDLNLQNGQFSDNGLEHLKSLTSLKRVFLSNAQVTAVGLKHLQDAKELESLYLVGTNYDDQALEQLSGLTNLKYVNVSQSPMTAEGFKSLTNLRFVNSLSLNDSNVTDEDLKRIVGLKSLYNLDLNGTFVSDAGLEHIASLPNLANLSLWNTRVSDAGLIHLKSMKSLTNLGLQNTRITDAGLVHLAELPNLTWLIIGGTDITDAGLKQISGMKMLKHLWLIDSPQISDEGIQNLRGLRLQQIQLGHKNPRITDASMASLAEMTTLKDLTLDGTRITDEGLKRLAGLPVLEHLSLRGTDVTDAGLALLTNMPKLKWLSLDQTNITDEGLKHLVKIHNLDNLWIQGTRVSQAAIEDLKKALPKCQIRWNDRLFPRQSR